MPGGGVQVDARTKFRAKRQAPSARGVCVGSRVCTVQCVKRFSVVDAVCRQGHGLRRAVPSGGRLKRTAGFVRVGTVSGPRSRQGVGHPRVPVPASATLLRPSVEVERVWSRSAVAAGRGGGGGGRSAARARRGAIVGVERLKPSGAVRRETPRPGKPTGVSMRNRTQCGEEHVGDRTADAESVRPVEGARGSLARCRAQLTVKPAVPVWRARKKEIRVGPRGKGDGYR
mmetsp:Transcript_36552/g.112618  ORF Transcript_36552/g.112618 Transcript_36552/m.112618 type:complete len:229 (-) Transcript_36552:7570-8256(-)